MKNLVYSVCTKHVLNILGICLLILSVEGSTNRPRGLRPELITFYNPKTSDGLFQCLDGSVTIKYLQVNDDYCDCPVRIIKMIVAQCNQFNTNITFR